MKQFRSIQDILAEINELSKSIENDAKDMQDLVNLFSHHD